MMMTQRSSISIEPLTPVIGAEIHGIDLCGELADDDVAAIREALNIYQVVFFRDQPLTPEQHLDFGRRFGELHVHPTTRGRPRLEWNELLDVHADENTGRIAGDKWHADVSCDEKSPAASILHLTTVPDSGGDTMFSSMYAAYDALSKPMKEFLSGLTATHDGAPNYHNRQERNKLSGAESVYPNAAHPVITTHSETGRKTIYVNSVFTTHINELAEKESDAVLSFLFAQVSRPEFHCRFKWQPNSVAFWDNRATQHLAIWDYYPNVRAGQRVTIRGDRPK